MRMCTPFGLTVVALLTATPWAGIVHAQSVEAIEDTVPATASPDPEQLPLATTTTTAAAVPPEIEALMAQVNTLRLERDAIGARLIEQITLNNAAQNERAHLSDALLLCESGRQVDQEALITLNERLAECSALPPSETGNETDEIAALEAQVAELEVRIRQAENDLDERNGVLQAAQDRLTEIMSENQNLRTRLETLGFPITPGFSYLGGDSPASYQSLSALISSNLGAVILEADQCDAVIAWMREQAAEGGRQVPIRLEAWVQGTNGFAICSPNASNGGSVSPVVERGTTEAHAITFQ